MSVPGQSISMGCPRCSRRPSASASAFTSAAAWRRVQADSGTATPAATAWNGPTSSRRTVMTTPPPVAADATLGTTLVSPLLIRRRVGRPTRTGIAGRRSHRPSPHCRDGSARRPHRGTNRRPRLIRRRETVDWTNPHKCGHFGRSRPRAPIIGRRDGPDRGRSDEIPNWSDHDGEQSRPAHPTCPTSTINRYRFLTRERVDLPLRRGQHEPVVLDADYLVVGAGATGMAFTDALIDHADVSVAMVDRRHGVGGHWLGAYPLVRLHPACAFSGG